MDAKDHEIAKLKNENADLVKFVQFTKSHIRNIIVSLEDGEIENSIEALKQITGDK